MRPIWAICTKSGQKWSRMGKKNSIMGLKLREQSTFCWVPPQLAAAALVAIRISRSSFLLFSCFIRLLPSAPVFMLRLHNPCPFPSTHGSNYSARRNCARRVYAVVPADSSTATIYLTVIGPDSALGRPPNRAGSARPDASEPPESRRLLQHLRRTRAPAPRRGRPGVREPDSEADSEADSDLTRVCFQSLGFEAAVEA